MGIKTKKFKGWNISYTNELELDEMLNELYSKKYYNWKTTKMNPVIFDVGALIGETALYFKDQYPQAQVTAFEPSPRSFALLKRNVFQNKLTQVKLINAAVAEKTGKMNFYTSKSEDSPWGRGDSLKENQFNDKQKSKVVKVDVVKLSKYIKDDIDLLKIDIEGAETEVMTEIESKLKHVKQIILEFHGSIYNSDNKYETIMDILKNNNFKTTIYFSRWLLPNSIVPYLLILLNVLKVKEYWLRIYAKRSD